MNEIPLRVTELGSCQRQYQHALWNANEQCQNLDGEPTEKLFLTVNPRKNSIFLSFYFRGYFSVGTPSEKYFSMGIRIFPWVFAHTEQFEFPVVRDENGTDIFRSYSRPNSFRGVLIHPYPSLDIQHPIPYLYPNTQIAYL